MDGFWGKWGVARLVPCLGFGDWVGFRLARGSGLGVLGVRHRHGIRDTGYGVSMARFGGFSCTGRDRLGRKRVFTWIGFDGLGWVDTIVIIISGERFRRSFCVLGFGFCVR